MSSSTTIKSGLFLLSCIPIPEHLISLKEVELYFISYYSTIYEKVTKLKTELQGQPVAW